MQRRTFLAGLASGIFIGSPAARASVADLPRKTTLATYVTNVGDLLGGETVPLRQGESLMLTRLPTRAYDPDSIGITTPDARLIGYLPSAQSRVLAPVMDIGVPVRAWVTRVKHSPRPAVEIEVVIEGPPVSFGALS